MKGVTYIEDFIENASSLFDVLVKDIVWDERMHARKTASYGKAYNYSQMSYPYQKFLPELEQMRLKIIPVLNFTPNNCLINYYLDGSSKMGYHSDQTDILEEETGVAIVSLGAERILRFRNIADNENIVDYKLASGSLFYMTQEVQDEWQHAIPKSDTHEGRLSLTFRALT